nr:glycosyltransferase [Helcobacillus sp. ACRRO]
MIGNGVDTSSFSPDGDLPDDRPDGPYFVYAGTVSEWQGADVFIDAFEQLRTTHPEARLLFFSEGTGRDQLEQTVHERGIDGVEFHGRAPASVVAGYIRGAVAGLSSITPGLGYEFALPTKMYAATGCGTPVIHAGSGAAHDRVQGNSLGFAAEYTAESVASAMRAAIDGPRPDAEHLRQWTEDNASLMGCARKGAAAVLATIRPARRK